MSKEKFYKNIGDVRGSEVEVIDKGHIDSGYFGGAFEVEVDRGGAKGSFVIKEYSSPYDASESLKNYKNAKKAGLKVFPTYRIDETGKKILMTTGFSDKWVCLGSNTHKTVVDYGQPYIESIPNFAEFLQTYFNQAIIATQNDEWLRCFDVPFFLIERGAKNSKLEFVLGDMDHIVSTVTIKDSITPQRALESNITNLNVPLREFLANNVKDNDRYFVEVQEYVEKITKEGMRRLETGLMQRNNN